jgi:hypothetical protein
MAISSISETGFSGKFFIHEFQKMEGIGFTVHVPG